MARVQVSSKDEKGYDIRDKVSRKKINIGRVRPGVHVSIHAETNGC